MLCTHHADFLRLFVVLFCVSHWTSSHERIKTEQEQHVEKQQTDDTDDEDHNHLLTTHGAIIKKGKAVCKLFMEIHLTTTEYHLPYGITQCYLPPDTSEHTPPLPQPDRLVLDLPTI